MFLKIDFFSIYIYILFLFLFLFYIYIYDYLFYTGRKNHVIVIVFFVFFFFKTAVCTKKLHLFLLLFIIWLKLFSFSFLSFFLFFSKKNENHTSGFKNKFSGQNIDLRSQAILSRCCHSIHTQQPQFKKGVRGDRSHKGYGIQKPSNLGPLGSLSLRPPLSNE